MGGKARGGGGPRPIDRRAARGQPACHVSGGVHLIACSEAGPPASPEAAAAFKCCQGAAEPCSHLRQASLAAQVSVLQDRGQTKASRDSVVSAVSRDSVVGTSAAGRRTGGCIQRALSGRRPSGVCTHAKPGLRRFPSLKRHPQHQKALPHQPGCRCLSQVPQD